MASHKFDQASWRVIKEFCGIYGVKMDYSKIKNLSRDKLSNAYFKEGKQPLITVKVSWNVNFDASGNSMWGNEAFKQLDATKSQNAKEWKATILKRVAQGYKNRQFYEAVAKLLTPLKMKCICGSMMGTQRRQMLNHYHTKTHINKMLKCVPVSSLSKNADERFNAHKISLAVKQLPPVPQGLPGRARAMEVNLRVFMKARDSLRETFGHGKNANIIVADLIKEAGFHTYDDLVEGRWQEWYGI